MKNNPFYQNLIDVLEPKKSGDHTWFLELLDEEKQVVYEKNHVDAVMKMLRVARLREHKLAIKSAQAQIKRIETEEEKNAENYCKIKDLLKEIEKRQEKIDGYRCFFDEPYFARMDLIDQIDGYNSYYIGKKGPAGWRWATAVPQCRRTGSDGACPCSARPADGRRG